MFSITKLINEIDEKNALKRIDMLYNKMIWLNKYDIEIDVLEVNDDYFNNILKLMRSRYGDKFNLFDKETQLRKTRDEYQKTKLNI